MRILLFLLSTFLISINLHAQLGLQVLDNGRMALNSNSTVGSSQFSIHYTSSGYGGMYINATSATSQPFYGYSHDGSPKAWHYYDVATSNWNLYNNGIRLTINDQGQVGIGNSSINPSAILELSSTNRGFLLPRMTSTQRNNIASAEGLMVYDTDSKAIFNHNGTSWTPIGGSSVWGINNNDIFYTTGKVTVGTSSPISTDKMTIYSEDRRGLHIQQNYMGGTANSKGIFVELDETSTSLLKTGVEGKVENGFAIYGVSGEVEADMNTFFAAGIYGKSNHVVGVDAWAGYFDGAVYSDDSLNVGDYISLHPNKEYSRGVLTLYQNSGQPSIQLRGRDNTNSAGDLILFNSNLQNSIELDGDVGGDGAGYIGVSDNDGTRTIELFGAEVAGQGGEIRMFNDSGEQTITIDSDYNNIGRVETGEIAITGGADLAELFETKEDKILPGSVVILDEENEGSIRLTNKKSDKRVVGVVSGAQGIKPGLLMGQNNTIAYGDVPVAMVGRVYVRVSEKARIKPGDFLTTGEVPGIAMKVERYNESRGSIIGKALTSSKDGYVLMIVHLQ